MRSTPDSKTSGKSIDKVTFMEYIGLPGIVSDRFFALARKESNNRVFEDDFMCCMLAVFSSGLE